MKNFLTALCYQFLQIYRDRLNFFWYMVFPLLLATIMGATFQYVEKSFEAPIQVAIEQQNPYQEMLTEKLPFKVKVLSKSQALKALDQGKVTAVIGNDLSMTIKEDGLKPSIVQSVLEELKQWKVSGLSIGHLAQNRSRSYMRKHLVPFGLLNTIMTSIVFMQCLYAAFGALSITNTLVAKDLEVRKRFLLAPIKKSYYLTTSVVTATCLNGLVVGVFLIYIRTVFNINLLHNLPYSFLILSLINILGALIGSGISVVLAEKSETLRNNLTIFMVLLLSQTSGMYGGEFLKMVHDKFPIWELVNPLLATQKFYGSVNYVGNHFFMKEFLASMGAWLAILTCCIWFFGRRVRGNDH